MDLTVQLRVCSIASSYTSRLRSAYELYSTAAKYNEPLQAAYAHNDDDRYDMVE